MKKQSIFNIIFTITIIVILTLMIIFVIYLSGRFNSLNNIQSDSSSIIPTTTQNTTETPKMTATTGTLVGEKSLSIRTSGYDGDVTVLHLCNGETAKTYETLCIGENILVLRMTDKSDIVINKQQVASAADALFLKSIDYLPENENTGVSPILLISFTKDTCAAIGDCGVGMPENHISYKVNLSDFSFSELKHYPQYGKANWSPYGHQAIFVPSSCGGAGCEEEPLFGYDLNTDKVTANLTKERGANYPDAVDVMGNPLSYWGDISWETATQAKATLVLPDGSQQVITINL